MQSVAAEMNLSETAYLHPAQDGYDLRWFTPAVEVDLCGHATLAAEAERIGFPLMLKAAAGGGGKGLRLVRAAAELAAAIERATGEARSAFGDDRLYLSGGGAGRR